MPEVSCGSPREGLKWQGRKEGIWNAAHMWVWITPSFIPLQGKSPCLCPPAQRDVIWPHPGGKPGCKQTNMKLPHIFDLSVNGFRQAWASAPVQVATRRWQGTRHMSRAFMGCAKCCHKPAEGEHCIATAQQPDPCDMCQGSCEIPGASRE